MKNLLQVTNTLSGHTALKGEFSGTLGRAGRLAEELTTELGRRKVSTEEVGLFTSGTTGGDLVPVVVNGKVVYRAVTDAAVVSWFVKEMAPTLDLAGTPGLRELDERFVKNYDTFRFLRTLKLVVEGALPGQSHGFVMVRHQANPAVIQTLEIPAITCR